jgi:hypothetical protein
LIGDKVVGTSIAAGVKMAAGHMKPAACLCVVIGRL